MKQPDRCKNIITRAKIQPFCRKYNLILGVYNVKQKTILPRSVTERNKCLYIQNRYFFVIQKKNQSKFSDASKELEEIFKYESNEISDVSLRQVEEYKFPISNDKNCVFAVFAFDLETCNVENQLYCEAYVAEVYHLNHFYEFFNGDLTEKDLEVERQHAQVVDRENGNLVLDMINYVVNNYKGKQKIFTNEYGKKNSVFI